MKLAKFDDLIGKPFEYGGRGPDSYDCYGLIRELLGRSDVVVPDYDSPSDQLAIKAIYDREIKLWERAKQGDYYIDSEKHGKTVRHHYNKGDVVLYGILGLGTHVGYVVKPNNFIHTWEDASLGACLERIDDWSRRIIGFYRYVGESE